MTPEALAGLHLQSLTMPRPWSAAEFADFLANPLCFLLTEPSGFLLGRVIADEAEVLTVAVAPEDRRHGTGGRLVAGFLAQAAHRGATRAFLEVAANNLAAIRLYRSAGFEVAGCRRAYYHGPDDTPVDAVVMARDIEPSEKPIPPAPI